MIKKIRIQIAVVLLALIFFFIAFAYGSALLDMANAIETDADAVLTLMNRGIVLGSNPDGRPILFDNPAFDDFDSKTLDDYNRQASFSALAVNNNGTIELSFVQKGDLYTTEEIEEIVTTILSNDVEKGRYEGYYFLTANNDNNAMVISVIDKNAEWDGFRRAAFSMLFINLTGFIITAIIVWILTGFITRPIADAMETKKRFISDASHELKTPLTIISANTEVLKEDLGKENSWLNNIQSQTARMQYLVQEMLQLSALEEKSKATPKERFSLSDQCEKTVLSFDAIAYERGLKLSYAFTPSLYTVGDSDAFAKIVGTLVDNAVKYASDHGEVKVTLKQIQSNAVLSVYNTGCGIKNSERKRVFERFYRSDQSRARETGGSGLGLSIAQATSKLNNWTLKLESEENVYTNFVLTVKLSQ